MIMIITISIVIKIISITIIKTIIIILIIITLLLTTYLYTKKTERLKKNYIHNKMTSNTDQDDLIDTESEDVDPSSKIPDDIFEKTNKNTSGKKARITVKPISKSKSQGANNSSQMIARKTAHAVAAKSASRSNSTSRSSSSSSSSSSTK